MLPYESLISDSQKSLTAPCTRNHRLLQALSQCQVVIGVICWALGALYLLRQGLMSGLSLAIFSGLYFIISGSVGICGAASCRRALLVAYATMCLHALVLVVPAMLVYSSLAVHFHEDGCYVYCSHLTWTCKLLCQGSPGWQGLPPQSKGRVVDIGLITTAVVEFLLALSSAILSFHLVCGSYRCLGSRIVGQLKNSVFIYEDQVLFDLFRCGYGLECSSCEFAVYCNDHCQAKAWETHRPECIFITRCPDSVPCGMVRLFSRIVVKLNNGGENEGSWFRTDYSTYERRLFKNLMSHQTRLFLESKRIREFAECCYALRSFMHSENIPFSSGLMEIFGKIVVNAFSILNDDLNPIGIGVYLNLSQLDHACDAENVVMFDGARALLNCLNPDHVDTSNDLRTHTISYDSVICETESRRRTLQSRYYFTCRCRRCLDLDLDAIATSSKCANSGCNGHVLLDVETGGGRCDGCSKAVDDLWPSVNLMLKVEKQNDALEERIPEEMNILS
ncbi:zf-MYND and CD20 domain containing protein [Trichuris trichiura]|uniref:Zf-MYND and CD20 domain containing protein n=1 Tax=Trichuris trichiura TaxID=36087 RepID=A0A077YX26_TRITR|nr:zf-MYND and CD20 domain containing protein [Trichuris trichiura]